MTTPVRTRRGRSQVNLDPVTPAKIDLPLKVDRRLSIKPQATPGMWRIKFISILFPLVKTVAASLAALDTPGKFDGSPASASTPYSKKPKSPEKKVAVEPEGSVVPVTPLPVHYDRFVHDLRILDEALSIFRIKNQIPYFGLLRQNIERVSGRRFSMEHFKQLMTATGGVFFKTEWQDVKDLEGKSVSIDLTVRAIDHENEGSEIFKRLTPNQSQSRKKFIISYLTAKLGEYLLTGGTPDNAFPIKPMELPSRPKEEVVLPSTPGRTLSRSDSVVSTPKSSTRRQLSVSASPIIPNALPLFLTPQKDRSEKLLATPLSAREKLDAMRNRVKAKEEVDAAEAIKYDKEMSLKEKLDEYDLCIRLLIKLNHKFPKGIRTAKLSTLNKEYGSLFLDAKDVERWTRKICTLLPTHFAMDRIGDEDVLQYKSPSIKFSILKKEIENMKTQFENIYIRE